MDDSPDTRWDRLCRFAASQMEKQKVPGIAVGVMYRGKCCAQGFGLTQTEHPLPVTVDTLFQIGSITKTFTATAVLRLVELGKLDLDAPVRRYLHEFAVADEAASSQATLRHIFTHTAGWAGDFFHDTGPGDDAVSLYVRDMIQLQQMAPLGAIWSYNNAGFSAAGRLIEVATNGTYQTAMKELIFGPLGLDSCYFDPAEVITHRFAVGHEVKEEGAKTARPWALPRSVHPQGGIVCHVRDLLRYARFHLGSGRTEDGTLLLSSESMALTRTPQVARWGRQEMMGLAWFIDDTDGVRQVSHTGGTNGQVSLLLLVPDYDFALAIVTNADRGSAITSAVKRWTLREYLGVDIPHPSPLDVPSDALRAYEGSYVRPFSELELGMLGPKLIVQVTPKGGFPTEDMPVPPPLPPMSLSLCEEDRLLVMDGPWRHSRLDVIRRSDGSIGWIRAGGRIHVRQK